MYHRHMHYSWPYVNHQGIIYTVVILEGDYSYDTQQTVADTKLDDDDKEIYDDDDDEDDDDHADKGVGMDGIGGEVGHADKMDEIQCEFISIALISHSH